MTKREVVIREIMSLIDCKYQVAKSILELSEKPKGTTQQIAATPTGAKRAMPQSEAKKLADAARERIRLVDSTG
jgi:hypothetical protein